jgi:hypothetical protein
VVKRAIFTLGAAERIADVVLAVENGNRDESPLVFPVVESPRRVFRVASYTGHWSIDTSKSVTLRNSTQTIAAHNLLIDLPDATSGRNCAIARDGSAWYLVNWQWDIRDFMHDVTVTTAAIEFSRYRGASLSTATTVSIAVTTCESTE